MRVFVAGATGVLGRKTVPRLIAAGHAVTAVARSDGQAQRLTEAGATPVEVDLFDPATLRPVVADHEAVVNLATRIPPMTRAALKRAWRTNHRLRTEASRNLVDAALAARARTFVQESINFTYIDGGDRWLDEDTPVEPVQITASALEAERQAARFAERGGRGIALRFGQLLAPDSSHVQEMLPIIHRGWLPLPGRHDGYVPFLHADDAATAVVAALEAPSAIYNVVEDEPQPRRVHAAALSVALGRTVRLPPQFLGRLPMARHLARSQRVSNRRLRTATTWAPTYSDLSQHWPELLAAAREEIDHVS